MQRGTWHQPGSPGWCQVGARLVPGWCQAPSFTTTKWAQARYPPACRANVGSATVVKKCSRYSTGHGRSPAFSRATARAQRASRGASTNTAMSTCARATACNACKPSTTTISCASMRCSPTRECVSKLQRGMSVARPARSSARSRASRARSDDSGKSRRCSGVAS